MNLDFVTSLLSDVTSDSSVLRIVRINASLVRTHLCKGSQSLLQWEEPLARRFYDGCSARFNNSTVMVVGKRIEKQDAKWSAEQKSNMQVAVGDLVEALYHGNCNGTRWYKQTVVTHVHDDGTVNLKYHDDDVEHNVEPQYIKVNGETLDQIRERHKQHQQLVTCAQ